MNLGFGLGACACDLVGQRHRRGFFCGLPRFLSGSFLVLASSAFGFFADAIDLTLELSIGVRANAGQFGGESRFSVGLDAGDFLGGRARRGLFGSSPCFLELAFAHRRGFRLHARDVFRLGALGSFLRALQLIGEGLVCAGTHARQFVGQLPLGFFANLSELGGERFTGGGLGGRSRLRDGGFTLCGRFGFHARHFRRALFRCLGTHALEFGRHLRGGLALRGRFRFDPRHLRRALLGGLCA